MTSESNQNNNCSICYDLMEDVNVSTTHCGHKFHTSCLINASLTNTTCPYCHNSLIHATPVDNNERELRMRITRFVPARFRYAAHRAISENVSSGLRSSLRSNAFDL